MKKQTKIICTLGPASSSADVLKKLAAAGMNCARHNFSHGDHEEQAGRMNLVRELNKTLDTPLSILLDTKGPEIRTHLFPAGKVEVKKGSTVRISMKEVDGTAEKFSVTYPGLFDDVEVGGTILVDDGYLELTIKEKDAANKELVCTAVNTHKIKDRRGINVPNVILNMPFISAKDKSDIEFGCDQKVDYIAASFVRRAQDVKDIKAILKAKGNDTIKIISKIENQEGVDNIDEIIEESDGIMVARGDLGVEIPAWEVPVIQKYIVEQVQAKGKIAVVATQMLESMQDNPRPTRAEVSDVYNAVLDGASATMLSGESAAGDYPVEAVTYMSNINSRAEEEVEYENLLERALFFYKGSAISRMISMSLAKASFEYDVKAIVTEDDEDLLRSIHQLRPKAQCYVSCKSVEEARKYGLNWGTHAQVKSVDELLKVAVKDNKLSKDDVIAVIDRRNVTYKRVKEVK